jgi:uncharacterized SAM-binding protein YcdF (DUF218 family)
MIRFFSQVLFLIALIMVFVWAAGYVAFTISIYSLKPVNTVEKTDAIVVLTGGNYRVKTGFDLWKAGLAPELFITGVNKSVTRFDLLQESGETDNLPPCCLTLGYKARSTKGNARETLDWASSNNIKSIRLVTSTYHLKRAMIEFDDVFNNDVILIPHIVEIPDYTPESRMFWYLSFVEYNKTLWRKLELTLGKDLLA